MFATRATDAALRILDRTTDAWHATAPLRERVGAAWHTHTSPARRAGQITGAALAALLALALATTLVTLLVRMITGAVASLVRGCVAAAAHLWNSGAADGVRDIADVPFIAARAWLRGHAQHLAATPDQIGVAALVLAAVLFISARRGSTAGRTGWALLGAAGCAAVWQGSPEGQRPAATAVAAGAWLLLAPCAYARRRRAERRTRLALDPAVEEALAVLAAAHRLPAPTPVPVQQAVRTVPTLTPHRRRLSPPPVPVQQAVRTVPTLTPHRRRLSPLETVDSVTAERPSAAGGFRCLHCAQPLAWAATDDDPERTWRTTDGATACADAPATAPVHVAL
ncbi:hypothetical protein OG196_43690 (plasmid) [Kitasatospora purpeofusca]|uniref:hypothetical protein n=1 Tax=Kitasatospora purpeofusca TaxID=67352 RepID=UPI002E140697|nr:hypothetical protein OG196_43690 [Kitasatospora purpeofusca]